MSDWKKGRLDKFFTLKRGYDLPKQNRNSGNIPIVSSSGVTDYHNIAQIEESGVITGRYGTIGEVFYSKVPFWPLNTTLYVNDFKSNDKKFVYYLLKTLNWSQFNDKSAVPGVNRNHVHELEISFPDICEQKSIASVLSSLDDKIDLLHRQNKTLESMAETLFRQWFIEEANEECTPGTLKEEFDFVMGQSPSGSSFNEDGIGMPMYQGNADFGFRFPSNRVFTTAPTRFAEPLDTLISVRAPVGAQNMALEKCCIGRGLSAFRFKTNPEFYTYTYFKLRQLMDEIKRFNDEGTVFGSISKSDFEKIEITIPPYDKICHFEDIAKPINDKVIKNCHQIEKLETLRDTLLPRLMSGEVRVQYAEEAISSVA